MTMVPVKPEIAARAHVSSFEDYQRSYRRSLEDPEGFWREQAEILTWTRARWTSRGTAAGG
jgi:acetyl-CoA synthetase